LGLDVEKKEQADEDMGEDELRLPEITAEDINPSLAIDESMDEVALQNLANTPALTGAIPMAIFDQAMKKFHNDERLAERFFDMVATFDQGTTTRRILQHIVDTLVQIKPDTVPTIACQLKLPLIGLDPTSADFPTALAKSLEYTRSGMKHLVLQKPQIAESAVSTLLPFTSNKELDPDVHKVIVVSLRQFTKDLGGGEAAAKLAEKLQAERRPGDAQYLLSVALRQDGSDARLLQMKEAMTAVVAT
jgi:U3 small nucleolar RNA-associated protein 6